jgi:hypothetical protein
MTPDCIAVQLFKGYYFAHWRFVADFFRGGQQRQKIFKIPSVIFSFFERSFCAYRI